MNYQKELSKLISQVLSLSPDHIYTLISHPSDPKLGDYSLPCFSLAKMMKKSPQVIAEAIKEGIHKPSWLEDIQALGGYLNFKLDPSHMVQTYISQVMVAGLAYGSSQEGKGKEVLLEHTSINPNASPHVGRGRNAFIGDFVNRLLTFEGYEVNVHYFVNDIGKQIAMLLLGAMDYDQVTFKQLLDIYVDINDQIKNHPHLEEEVFDLLYRLEAGDQAIKDKFKDLVDICIKGQSKIFEDIGIHYQTYDYESDYIWSKRTDEILTALEKTGYLFEDDLGRMVLNLEDFGLSYLVVTRKDKTSLYPLRDIAYTIDKAKAAKDRNMIVLGEDQKLYFKQVAKAVSLLGFKPPEVVHYAFVLLTDGSMSTRSGNVVLLEDLMSLTEAKAQASLESNHIKDTSTAKAIGYGAIKYAMLSTSNDRNVTFDIDQSLSFEGESSPYIQYCLVRIKSLLEGQDNLTDQVVIQHPVTASELALSKCLADFPSVIKKTSKDMSPHTLAKYLYKLTKKFASFYHECPILKETEEIKISRLQLCKATDFVLKNGLKILGIEGVDKM